VVGAAAGDLGADAALAEVAAAALVVVGAVSGYPVGTSAWSAGLSAHGRHLVDERDQLGAVVAVPAREAPGERQPATVYQEVVLGAVSGSINRARARFGAPFFA